MDSRCDHCGEGLTETTSATCAKCQRSVLACENSGSDGRNRSKLLSLLALQKAVLDKRTYSSKANLEGLCVVLASEHAPVDSLQATPVPADQRETVLAPPITLSESEDEEPTLPYDLIGDELVPAGTSEHDTDEHMLFEMPGSTSAAEREGRLRPWMRLDTRDPDDLKTLVSSFNAMRNRNFDREGPLFGDPARLALRRESNTPPSSEPAPSDRAAAESLTPFAFDEPIALRRPRRHVEYVLPQRSSNGLPWLAAMALVVVAGLYGHSMGQGSPLAAATAAATPGQGRVVSVIPEAPPSQPAEVDSASFTGGATESAPEAPVTPSASKLAVTRPVKVSSSTLPASPPGLDSESLSKLADEAREHGDHGRARRLFNQVLAINPNYLPARVSLADMEWAEGNYVAAQTAYRRIVADLPDDLVPHYVRARAVAAGPARPAFL